MMAQTNRKAASTEAEAQKRAEALAQAGVVLRFNGMVYLKPEEVSELVYKVGQLSSATPVTALSLSLEASSCPGHSTVKVSSIA